MSALLALAAAGLALVTAMALAARLWWAFDLFSHFRLQYAVLAAALGIAALLARAYPAAAVLAVLALVHVWAVKDLRLGPAPATASAAAGGEPLRVVSANVRRGNPTPGKVLDFVQASGADIVVLVEAMGARWRGTLAAVGHSYPHRAPREWRDGAARVVLFSRGPILAARLEHGPGRRPHLVAEVAALGGVVTVVGVHPSAPSPTKPRRSRLRDRQLDHLAATVDGTAGPLIVAGDLNTSPWSPHFRDLLAATGLRNAALGHGWLATWPVWFWPARIPIDHVLVRGPVEVASVARGPDVGSDHFPVVADLTLAAGR